MVFYIWSAVLKNNMLKLGFIGTGTIGSALALKLSCQGYPVVAASSRHHTSAKKLAQAINRCLSVATNQEVADAAELIFITTPDDIIAFVAAQVKWRRGQMVVHCSGADSTDILEPVQKAGACVGVFHPLQTFANAEQALGNLPGSTFTLEAEEPLLGILQKMASSLEGRWIKIKVGDRSVYHAAAVIACNYLVTLLKMATELWQTFGVSPKEATEALLPLIRGTVHNIETIGLPWCLTGPIARGDSGTIEKHLEALERVSPDILSIYRKLGLKTIPIALAKGRISECKAEELKVTLER